MTQDNTMHAGEIEALAALLASHGADRTRWPAPERLRFASLLATSGHARRLLKEAEALDRLLNMAPQPDKRRTASLAERIVAAATAEGGHGAGRALAASALRSLPASRPRPSARALPGLRPAANLGWRTAGLLAASLLIGAFAGTAGLVDSALAPLAAAIGAESEESGPDGDVSRLALGEDAESLLEEDLL